MSEPVEPTEERKTMTDSASGYSLGEIRDTLRAASLAGGCLTETQQQGITDGMDRISRYGYSWLWTAFAEIDRLKTELATARQEGDHAGYERAKRECDCADAVVARKLFCAAHCAEKDEDSYCPRDWPHGCKRFMPDSEGDK